jgi:hypothetical protein
MLSSSNEFFVIGALIAHLAFMPALQIVRDLLATSVGKAAALAGIVYVHKYLSCPVALLLTLVYLRAGSWEGFTTPTTTVAPTVTCPSGYALDALSNSCKPVSAMSGSIPPSSSGSLPGADVTTPPPMPGVSSAPMTTPTPTMPPVTNMPAMGGVQPSGGSSSTMSPV